MLSPNVEVQSNTCVTNLATHDDDRQIWRTDSSHSIRSFERYACSVERYRSSAGHDPPGRESAAIGQRRRNPRSRETLNSPTTALSNIAADGANRKKLTQSEPKLVTSLVALMESTGLKVQCQAALALRNLASDEKHQLEIVRADGLSSLLRLLQSAYLPLILSSAACLLEMGICEVLIPLTNSPSSEVQGNSAAALGNLSSKDGHSATVDYSAFNDVWKKPDDGMHRYLYRFLSSPDATFQHIAVWTIVQLLESGGLLILSGSRLEPPPLTLASDPRLINNILSSTLLVPNIRNLTSSQASSPSSSVGSRSKSYDDTEANDGQGEIQLLARRILEFVDGDGGWHGSLQRDTVPHTARVVDIKFEGCEGTRGAEKECERSICAGFASLRWEG
ncbi:Vacuolar protein 8 [Marasmius sp. AFHP31]|nr:Vacuolar protein 8 [Marasmius sp. AFHP31]